MFVFGITNKLPISCLHSDKFFTNVCDSPILNKKYKIKSKFFSEFLRLSEVRKNYSTRNKFLLYLNLLGYLSGVSETFYLFIIKTSNVNAICLNGSCEAVLNSVFSDFTGVPVTILGSMLYFCLYVIFYKKLFEFKNCKKTILLVENYFTSALLFTLLCTSLCFFSLLNLFFQLSCFWCMFSIFNVSLISFYHMLSKKGRGVKNMDFKASFVAAFFFLYFVICSFFLNIFELLTTIDWSFIFLLFYI